MTSRSAIADRSSCRVN